MQRPPTGLIRPSTSSGTRVVGGQLVSQSSSTGTVGGGSAVAASNQTAADGFIVRIRSSRATSRCRLTSADSTIQELRQAIFEQCQIRVEHQLLTRQRRPWFVDTATSAAPIIDDFPSPSATMIDSKIQHGDMLFIESNQPVISNVDIDAAANALADAAIDDKSSVVPDLIRSESQSLIFKGADFLDEPDSYLSTQQQTALQLLATIRQQAIQIQPDSASNRGHIQESFDELQRLIQQLSATHRSNSTFDLPVATASPDPDSVRDESDRRSQRSDSQLDQFDEDDSRASSRGGNETNHRRMDSANRQRVGSAGIRELRTSSSGSTIPPPPTSDSPALSTASATTISELTSDLQYWRGRYDRLRIKAEKMNTAGMSLKNKYDTMLLTHEQSILILKNRLKKRDERIQLLERTVQAWEQKDLAQGGDGMVYVEPLSSSSTGLTSLASAPTLSKSQSSHHPSPPGPTSASGHSNHSDPYLTTGHESKLEASPSPPSTAKRVARPDSASRYRGRAIEGNLSSSSRPTSTFAAAMVTAMPTPPPSASSEQDHHSQPGKSSRPSSSSRSSRPTSSESTNPLGDSSPIAVLDVELEARRYKQQQDESLVAASRSSVRQVIDASKQSRMQLASAAVASSRNGPVAVRGTPPTQTRPLVGGR